MTGPLEEFDTGPGLDWDKKVYNNPDGYNRGEEETQLDSEGIFDESGNLYLPDQVDLGE